MPDISLCTKRDLCYRYMAIPNQWQSYMEFNNICTRENNFKWFYPIDGRPVRRED